ncbi:MAG: hypothetical protein JWO76_1099 [Nocardioides sp.]|nr:hypothetical protein [Nocardioides sp.]
MTTTTGNPTTLKIVAGAVTGIDTLLLLVAGWFALDTFIQVSAPGPSGLTGLGYLFAMLFAAVALPSLLLAVAALYTRGAVAVACATLSVLCLVAAGVFAVNYV